MKNLKKIMIACLIFAFGSSAFAINSGLRSGSAFTLMDDSYYYMNLVDWEKLSFNKFYGFTAINSTNSINLFAAQKVKDGNLLAYSYDGNLWTENGYNDFSVFYGFGKMALKFDLGLDETTKENVKEPYTIWIPAISFGMDVSDKFAFSAGLGLASSKIETEQAFLGETYTITDKYSNVSLFANGYYNIKNTDKLFAQAIFGYSGNFEKEVVESDLENSKPQESKTNSNSFFLSAELQYKPTSAFTYAMKATFPRFTTFTRADETSYTTMSFFVNNGFMVELKPNKFFTSFGIATTLPSFTFEKDVDTVKGALTNTYYLGMAVNLAPQIRLDGRCTITPTTGISMEKIFQQALYLSLTAKF